MQASRWSIVAVGVVLAGALAWQSFGPRATLKWLKRADPVRDADRAIAGGDLRPWAVRGYSLRTPGDPRLRDAAELGRCRVRVVPFTSDDAGGIIRRINTAAEAYAEPYNRRLVKRAPPGAVCPRATPGWADSLRPGTPSPPSGGVR